MRGQPLIIISDKQERKPDRFGGEPRIKFKNTAVGELKY